MTNRNEWCEHLQNFFREKIPITAHMGVQVQHFDGRCLRLTAPLAPNVNDKGTAFGGSLSSIMTLAGWGLLYLNLKQLEIECDLMIHKGELTFFQPVNSDFSAYCDLPGEGSWRRFLELLQERGRARLPLRPWIGGDDGAAASMSASFVALHKTGSGQ